MYMDVEWFIIFGNKTYRTVTYLICNLLATVKPTKTNRLVLRCDNCGMLLFANGEDAQERLSELLTITILNPITIIL